MSRVVTALAVSAEGYIAGPNDGPGNPLGDGGGRLFEWYTDGDTQSRFFPQFRSQVSARMSSTRWPPKLGRSSAAAGGTVRLLDGTAANLRLASLINAPGVTHLTYEVLR